MRWVLSKALRTCAGFLALAVLAVVGCGGGGTGTITGKVTYKGKDGNVVTLKGGNVIFASEKGPSLQAEIKEDGTYTLENVPVGEAKVAVRTAWLGIQAAMGKGAASGPPKDASGPMPGKMTPDVAARKFVAIPSRYETPDGSGLVYAVKKGSQTHDIPLEGPLDSGGGSVGGPSKGGSSGGPPKK